MRELVGDLVTLVKDRASDVGQARGSAHPTSEQVELAILAVLADGSKNTSDIVSALSLAAAGAWAPTTGKIHPALAK